MSPQRGVEEAIEIAICCGMELRIAAKIDPIDEAYCKERIQPFFNHPLISFIGEISELEKPVFLGKAAALFFPIQWPEPFGLVMIESLVCGTPVIAFNQGSVPEILENFVNGFIVNSVDEEVAAVGRLDLLSRHSCRERFDKRFSASQMVDAYLEVYNNLLSNKYAPPHEGIYLHAWENHGRSHTNK